jgi:hypothetical protein
MKEYQSLLKLFFSIIWLTLIYTTQLFATDVSGEQSGRWNQDRSPYLIKGDIIIPSDQILIIEPGVILQFTNFNKISVHGTLRAKGTSKNRIIFTSDNDFELSDTGSSERSPGVNDWEMIEFLNDGEQRSYEMPPCVIRYSERIIQCNNAAPFLKGHYYHRLSNQ